MSTAIKDTFDELLRHDAMLLSVAIDRRSPGDRDEVELIIRWADGQRARLVFTTCRALDAQLNFGIFGSESILRAECLTDSSQIEVIRRDWEGFAIDFSSLRSFEFETGRTGSRISIVAPGLEFREPPAPSWFTPRKPDDENRTSASPDERTIKERFDDFVWHDATLLWIEVDRRDPGHRDEIVVVVEWPDNRRNRLVFTNCYLFEVRMNFGIIASESILDANCSTDTPEVAKARENCRRHGADLMDLHCFEIETNSTGGTIRIVARGFEVHEPPDDAWFPPRDPDNEDDPA